MHHHGDDDRLVRMRGVLCEFDQRVVSHGPFGVRCGLGSPRLRACILKPRRLRGVYDGPVEVDDADDEFSFECEVLPGHQVGQGQPVLPNHQILAMAPSG